MDNPHPTLRPASTAPQLSITSGDPAPCFLALQHLAPYGKWGLYPLASLPHALPDLPASAAPWLPIMSEDPVPRQPCLCSLLAPHDERGPWLLPSLPVQLPGSPW